MAKNLDKKLKLTLKVNRVPTVLQMEAVECGAACLAMILGYYKKFIPLEELRLVCGVSRDGSKASNIVKAAATYGLECKGFRKEPEALRETEGPMIIHWNFNHFVVLEGFNKNDVFINDPGYGRRKISYDEFDQSFTGVVLTFKKNEDFNKGGDKGNLFQAVYNRLKGVEVSVIFILLIGVALVIPGIVIPIFSKIFVDNILIKRMTDWVKPLLLAMFITAILRGVLLWFQEYFLLKLETKLSLMGSSKFLWHVLRLPISFFSQRLAGEITNRILLNDSSAILLSQKIATAILDVLMISFYAVLLFQYDVVLTLIGILIAILNLATLKFSSKKIIDGNIRLSIERGKMIGVAMSGLSLIETLKASGKESDFFSKWSGYQAKLMNSEQEMGETSLFLQTIPPFLTIISTALILIIGGIRVIDGYLTLGMLVAFQSLMSSFLAPIKRLVDVGIIIEQVKGDFNKLNDVFNHEIDQYIEKDEKRDINKDESSEKLKGYVTIKNLTFGYSKLEPPLIENFSLNLKPGSRVALVGGSGSGKSTVVKIVSGLFEPWAGEILFDNKSREEIPRNFLCSSLAMVDQDIVMFEGSIKDNLTLWDTTTHKSSIIKAAKDACIHDVISGRNGGYEHQIEEGGKNFSGGQRQRLEIARALVGDPRILILDEATSALDPKTEKEVDENIRKRGCTCIIVAHRLSTIRDADEIIVLEKGKIVQRGTHEELKNKKGLYADLIKEH